MHRIFIFLCSFIVCTPTFAQQPYFQQRVEYTIDVQLNDVQHTLSCFAKYNYTNNSNDTLRQIWFHVWPNAYGDRKSALQKEFTNYSDLELWFADSSKIGGIRGLDFKTNNQKLLWSFDPKNPDICSVQLAEPLLPGKSCEITTPFLLKIPSNEFSRMGHKGNDYQLTQWYPKPAVYNKNGWNAFPYLDQGEFFSEFGKFTVSITLPSNYVVASTGRCITASEEEFINQRASETIIDENYKEPESSKTLKTIVFEQDSIHDFAWFANKSYKVLKGQIKMPNSNRIVEVRSYYTPNVDKTWKNSLDYIKDAVLFYSKRVGEYPYSMMSAIYADNNTGSAMEYPMIVNISSSGSDKGLDWVITHEIGHNWFYGILANNERIDSWMDEGINSYYDFCYIQEKYPSFTMMGQQVFKLAKFPTKYAPQFERLAIYLMLARRNLDQPCNIPAAESDPMNYTGIVYEKTAFIFNYLDSYLGREKFDDAMKHYFETWKFQHPEPNDLKDIFEKKTSQNLAWFFGPIISSSQKMDFSIHKVKFDVSKQVTQVEVKNYTKLEAPFRLSFYKDNQLVKSEWFGPTAKKKYVVGANVIADKVVLDDNYEMPEISRSRHIYNCKKLFPYCKPIHLQFAGGLENPEKSEVYWLPAAAWNFYDKWQAGMIIHNAFPLSRQNEFLFMPLYSFSSNKLNGVFEFQHHIKPTFGQNLTLSLLVKNFAYAERPQILNYTHLRSKADFLFKKNKDRFIDKNLQLEYIYLIQDQFTYTDFHEKEITTQPNSFLTLSYLYKNKRVLNPYHYNCKIESNEYFAKASAEFDHTFHYNKKKTFKIRFFGGAFLAQSKNYYGNYNFRMSGLAGYQDYTKSDWFLGRTEESGIASQQMIHRDGDFKIQTIVGQSNKWIMSMNAETALPGLIPFKLYVDVGTYHNAKNAYSGSKMFPWDFGLKLGLFKDAVELFFPLTMSSDIKEVSKLNDEKFVERIRICINLEKMNFVGMVKRGEMF